MDKTMRQHILNVGAISGACFAAFDIFSYLFNETLPASPTGQFVSLAVMGVSLTILIIGTTRYRTMVGGYATFRTMFTVFTLSAFASVFIMASVRTVPMVIDPDLKERLAVYQEEVLYDVPEDQREAAVAVSNRFLPEGEKLETYDDMVEMATTAIREQSVWANLQSMPVYGLMYAVIGLILAAVTQRKQRFE